MVKTLLIPFLAGLFCFLLVGMLLHVVMPVIPLDDHIKGLVKLVLWIVAFAVPADYLRKKAKLAEKASAE